MAGQTALDSVLSALVARAEDRAAFEADLSFVHAGLDRLVEATDIPSAVWATGLSCSCVTLASCVTSLCLQTLFCLVLEKLEVASLRFAPCSHFLGTHASPLLQHSCFDTCLEMVRAVVFKRASVWLSSEFWMMTFQIPTKSGLLLRVACLFWSPPLACICHQRKSKRTRCP
jgi:hypothetical protein